MAIEYAILGLLSWKPLAGYDIKKVFADSAAFYWSGNNNQIYTTLVRLHDEGLVTQEIHHQENLPARKVYTITEKGLTVLKTWVQSTPELPEFRNTFLIQLTWAGLLDETDLDELLAKYEEELRIKVLMEQEKASRSGVMTGRTARETYLWKMVSQNVIAAYQHELDWIRQVRAGISQFREYE